MLSTRDLFHTWEVLYFLCKLITVVLTIVPCVCLLRACIATVLFSSVLVFMGGFSGGSDSKASVYNAGDRCSIPGLGRSPGEGIATHSSILAWKIPWMEEPGKLQSMGSQRVGHD